jgi:hypothetical protein
MITFVTAPTGTYWSVNLVLIADHQANSALVFLRQGALPHDLEQMLRQHLL